MPTRFPNNLAIRLETMAGAVVEQCIDEAIELANRLNFSVIFKHNYAELEARPGSSRERLIESWGWQMAEASSRLAKEHK